MWKLNLQKKCSINITNFNDFALFMHPEKKMYWKQIDHFIDQLIQRSELENPSSTHKFYFIPTNDILARKK